jgi:hypothetical protein
MPLNADIEIMRTLASESGELEELHNGFQNVIRKGYRALSLKYFYENKKTHRTTLGFITWIREFVRKAALLLQDIW